MNSGAAQLKKQVTRLEAEIAVQQAALDRVGEKWKDTTWRPGNGLRRSFDKRIALVREMPIPRDRGKLAGFFITQPKDFRPYSSCRIGSGLRWVNPFHIRLTT